MMSRMRSAFQSLLASSPGAPVQKQPTEPCAVALEEGKVGRGFCSFTLPITSRTGTPYQGDQPLLPPREAVTQFYPKKLNFSQLMYKDKIQRKDTFRNISADHIKVLVTGKSNTFDV